MIKINPSINPSSVVVESEELGRGSFGAVFVGKWNGKRVAVKEIQRKGVDDLDEEILSELSIQCSLRHKNVAQLYGYYLSPGKVSLVIEICERGTMQQHLAKCPPPPLTERYDMALQLSEVVEFLHDGFSSPVLHRDLKPENIFLNGEGELKLGDFGLSRLICEGEVAATCCGSRLWMPPEVLFEEPYTEKADVYSLALVLWEILEWKNLAESGVFSSNLKMVDEVAAGIRPPIPDSWPTGLKKLIISSWQGESTSRPSAGDFATFFQNILGRD